MADDREPIAEYTSRVLAGERHDQAIDLIAASIVARAADAEIRDSREEYADIGEHDWQAVVAAAERMAPFPDANAVDDAYEHLAQQAGTEATP